MRSPINILVVDDEKAICDLLREVLTGEGFHVECAATGVEMRMAVGRDRFDLVILDAVLPDERGLELADKAARDGASVILMSGHPQLMPRIEGSRYSSLPKPFRMSALCDLVRIVAAPQSEMKGAEHGKRDAHHRSHRFSGALFGAAERDAGMV
jgi:DNA-binding response OmpR family regulator